MVEEKASGDAERKVVDDEHGGRFWPTAAPEGKGDVESVYRDVYDSWLVITSDMRPMRTKIDSRRRALWLTL